MTLNVDKTKYMVFDTKHMLQHKPDLNISIDGKKVDRVSVMKYLGMFLDLTFSAHVTTVCKKSSKRLGILCKARKFLDRKTTVYLIANETDLKNLQLILNPLDIVSYSSIGERAPILCILN